MNGFSFRFLENFLGRMEERKGGRRKRGFLKLLNISLEIFEENREMERNFRDPREYIP